MKEENNKFEPYAFLFGEFSFTELKDEPEEILGTSDISHEHLDDKIMGPRISTAYYNLSSE